MFFGAAAFGELAFAEAPAPAARRGVDVNLADPLWMEWWQNEADRQRKKAEAVAQLEASEPQTDDAPVKFELVKRKRAVLSARTLAGIEDAQGIDDLERLALTLRRTERRILREMIARYERERDEEEAIELLLF